MGSSGCYTTYFFFIQMIFSHIIDCEHIGQSNRHLHNESVNQSIKTVLLAGGVAALLCSLDNPKAIHLGGRSESAYIKGSTGSTNDWQIFRKQFPDFLTD